MAMRKQLKDICRGFTKNIALKDLGQHEGQFPIYGASGYIKDVDFYCCDTPYIGVVKDGSGVGRVDVYPGYSSLLGTMQYIVPNDEVDLQYLKYALIAMDLGSLYKGAAIPHIYFKEYGKFFVDLPDLETQKHISASLDTIQKAIDLKRKQLQDLDELVKSKFQERFGDPLENEKRWAVLPLSSIGSIARGVSKHRPRNAPELLGDYMPFIQTGDIANSGMYISNCQSGYSELGVEQSKIWHKGTLCITIAANIGKCAIMTFDACFPDSVVGFIANPSIVKVEYVYFYFLWIQQALEDNAIGVAQKNINLGVLNNMNIPVPPIEQQNSFVEYVKKADAAKAIIKQEISGLEEMMDSKMDEYFG